ncbi:hypothetical protein ACGVWS_01555 [Enterobacteriaceae bacterium LUAb1]
MKQQGQSRTGHQGYRGQTCCRCCQFNNEYCTCQPTMKTQHVGFVMNNADIRNTAQQHPCCCANLKCRNRPETMVRYDTRLPETGSNAERDHGDIYRAQALCHSPY